MRSRSICWLRDHERHTLSISEKSRWKTPSGAATVE